MFARIGYGVIREALPAKLFQAFAVDPARHCAELQGAIMRSRQEQWSNLVDTQKVVFDRSLDEDAAVFCRMHYERGLIDAEALGALQALAGELQASMPAPNLIVYMSTGLKTLRERIVREEHPHTIIDSLEQQVSLYEDWISRRQEDVLKIDNSACSLRLLRDLVRSDGLC
jgi:deoxyadenosine/deoxycytidine kinase